MASGFFQGGFAEGAATADRLSIADRQTGVLERRQQFDERQTLIQRADEAIGNTMQVVAQTIEQARAAGASPDKIRRTIAPLMQDVNEIAAGAGRDPARFTSVIEAQINAPVQTEPTPEQELEQKLQLEALEIKRRKELGLAVKGESGATKEPTTAQKNELGRAEAAVKSLTTEIDNFEKLIQQEGANILPFTVAAEKAAAARRNIQLQLKELFNLGVLNGPDLALMDQMITDPTLDLNPIGPTGSGAGRMNIPINIQARAKASLAQLRQQIQTVLESKREAFTGEVPKRDNNAVLEEARDAIARGASREAVLERLELMGIDPSGL